MSATYPEIEEAVGRPHRTVQYVVRDLESIGLLQVGHIARDRRRRTIHLTARGRNAFVTYVRFSTEFLVALVDDPVVQDFGTKPTDPPNRS